MPENPSVSNLGMNGILSKSQLAGTERIFGMRQHASGPETLALAEGVVIKSQKEKSNDTK
jgi:hypothetical protein